MKAIYATSPDGRRRKVHVGIDYPNGKSWVWDRWPRRIVNYACSPRVACDNLLRRLEGYGWTIERSE